MSDGDATAAPAPARSWLRTKIDLLQALGWPILLRELRADFRRNRFLLTHSLCLCLLGTVVLVLVAAQVENIENTPVQIGRRLFGLFFDLQYLVVLLVFPAFSATTFAEERNRFTLDLLLTTTLKPRQIVWGKFLASSVYCLLYVIASIPLMAVSFLFGGITLVEVTAAYLLLIALTLLVSMLGVCISSCYSTGLRSTLTMYAAVFAIVIASIYYYRETGTEFLGDQPIIRHVLDATLGWGSPGFVGALFAVVGILGAAFGYLFIVTTNRIRPPADNKATALRVLTLFAVVGVLWTLAWSRWQSAGADPWSVVLWTAFTLGFVAWIFPTEDAQVSRRNRRAFGRVAKIWYPLRVFAPGAFWGFVYAVVTSTAVSAGLLALWGAIGDVQLDGGVSLVEGMLGFFPFYFAAIAAGGFLLAVADFSPLYARLTVLFALVITVLLPVIFALTEEPDAVWTLYYLSPVTLWWSLDPDPHIDTEITYELYGVPVIQIARLVYGGLAVAFLLVGVIVARRSGYPLLSFAERPAPTKPVAEPVAAD